MPRISDLIAYGLFLLGLVFLAFFGSPPPAVSAELPCFTPAAVAKYVAKNNGMINGMVTYEGTYADMTLIYTLGDRILWLSFNKGCAIGPAADLDRRPSAPASRPPVDDTPA